jgi:hypothetical protein
VELAEMISNEIKNCKGIVVSISPKDTEEDVTAFKGILSHFNFIFNM